MRAGEHDPNCAEYYQALKFNHLTPDTNARNPKTMLSASGLVKRFAGFTAVDHATIEIKKGAITACVGPNGAGKSTLVGLLSGSLRPDSGCILLDGADVTSHPAWRRAGLGLRRTFQNMTGIGEMTVRENLELGMWRQRRSHAGAEAFAHTPDGIAELLGLEAHSHVALSRLPLGIQRKAGIGVAMIGNPSHLLLDEPLAGTESNERAMLLQVFRDLARLDLGIMWIEHDLASVRSAADFLVVVDKGRVIADGPVEAVINNPAVQSSYWGSATNA
ncbi:branched-chain amino acid transport system ATP-binding protein [Rhizobiales bacterium GAS113]|nr:branched-chain amino acid transport system ATP-binding protein [Rhizobiales bacterium GAS113]